MVVSMVCVVVFWLVELLVIDSFFRNVLFIVCVLIVLCVMRLYDV